MSFGTKSFDNFLLRVGLGLEPGWRFIEKFGSNTANASGTQETVADGGGLYQRLSTARIHDIVSTSGNDTSAGSGLRTLLVSGLDANYNEISETITMNGLTDVPTTKSYIRIYRMKGLTGGTIEASNEGLITATAQTDLVVSAQIPIGNGQTEMCVYTVPAGKLGYLVKFDGSILRATGVTAVASDFNIYVRDFGGIWRSQKPKGMLNTGSGITEYKFECPIEYDEKTDIELRATPTALASLTGGFLMLLKDK